MTNRINLAIIALLIIMGCSSTELYVYNEDYTEAYDPSDSLLTVETIPATNNSTPPTILKQVYFKMPKYVNYDRIYGDVVVKMFISANGNVIRVKVINSSDIILNKAMIESFMQWKFNPAKLNNQPIAIWLSWPVRIKQPTGR